MSALGGGSQLGRYRILRRLGAGAMGEVFLAEDPQIGRQLALKTVCVEEGKPREVEDRKQRLLREARAAGRLLHPRIVTLFDAGEDQGLLYLAFEYVDGSDLEDRINDGAPLTLAEALAIVRQAAEGLDFAHRQGVIHRDVKPSNLMLTADGEVKMADFGIAKVLDSTSGLTMTGSVVGSPHYLSPEQVRNEPLDGRTDIFSLGVMLYEMLCRQRPFDGQTLTTLVYQILNQEPTPIEVRRPDLGPRVEQLVRRMMHKDRELRFATAGELAAEIRDCERELASDLLSRSLAVEGDLPGPTVRLATDPSTAAGGQPVSTAPMPPGAMPPPPPPVAPVVTSAPSAAAPRGRLAWLLAADATLVLVLIAFGLGSRRWAAGVDGGKQMASAISVSPPKQRPIVPIGSAPSAEGAEPRSRAKADADVDAELPALEDDQPLEPIVESDVLPGDRAAAAPATQVEANRERPSVEPRRVLPLPLVSAGNAGPSALGAGSQPAAPAALGGFSSPPPSATEPVERVPPADPRAMRQELIASVPVARELTAAMTLSIEIEPKELAERLVVRLDRIVLGRAAEWNASKRGGRAYLVPELGLHILTFLLDGNDIHRIRIDAQEGSPGPTRIQADLTPFGRRARRRPGRR